MPQKVREFMQSDVGAVAKIFENVQDGWSKQALQESLSNNALKSFVLEQGEEILSFVSYLVSDDAELVFIVTNKKHLKKGCAHKLLKDTLDILSLPCVLEVRESNFAAISLYEKLGFALIGKRKNFYSNPKETALIYKRN